MLISKQNLQKFNLCFKFFLQKFLSQPLNVTFSVAFPIVWLVASYLIFSYNKSMLWEHGKLYPWIIFSGAAPLFFAIIVLSLMSFPINTALDRIHHRLKIFRSFGLNKNEYVFVNFVAMFAIYFAVFLVQVLLLNFAFGVMLSAGYFFLVIVINLWTFLVSSMIGFYIGTLPKKDKSAIAISLTYFYPVLLLSGITIPPFVFDQNQLALKNYIWGGITDRTYYSWFKFIQFLSPIGTGIYLTQDLSIWNKTGVNLFSWDVDWIGIALQIIIALICFSLTMKKFQWK